MGYKVTRTESIKRRPEWMISLLMEVNPGSYRVQRTWDDACNLLMGIGKTIKNTRLCERSSRVRLHEEKGALSLVNSKGKPVLSFCVTEANL